ncbi:MAG TPA: Hsp20/alpha crystallin family protein [Candidatus Hydrogenedentes bacterium]|nr:Hsp20/alpha crystallin family protein [Candidatus Hydrogenedentota bacterium]
MTDLVPVSRKTFLDDLRGSISGTLERWLPAWAKRQENGNQDYWQDYWPSPWTFTNIPAVELQETEDELCAVIEVPGLSEKDLNVELDGRRLLVRGEKKSAREEKKGACYYSECNYGSFYRAIPLPCDVEEDKVNASYKQGVVRITLPKTEEAKAKKIPIKVA